MNYKTNLQILLVEDDLNFEDWVSLALTKAEIDHKVVLKTSGEEAISTLKAGDNEYDLIITDCFLSDIPCMEFLERLRQEDIDLPVIVLCERDVIQIAALALQSGAVDYIIKDRLNFQLLPLIVKRAYHQKQLEKQNGALKNKITQQNRELADINRKMMQSSKELLNSQKLTSLLLFVRAISHDLNNPLAGIVGFSELLLNKIAPIDPIREDMEEIRDCGYRLKDTISKLARFCGSEKSKKKKRDLNELLEETIQYFRPRADRYKIKIETDYAKELLIIEGIPVSLQQAFMMILLSCRDSMLDGGEIIISTDRYDDHARLLIRDTSKGMNEEDLEKIFSPFFNIEKSGDAGGQGLALTYSLIREFGGELKIDSKIGTGTTVTLLIPLAER
ncbi:MAG: hybrid sensor histidine kinase/response regulator [Candidatus Eremiobacteraeota bacterium]|nr:hybrid sensor histidine kinase/response regulator [Candidatus Eremiobacteraeota bacterium]